MMSPYLSMRIRDHRWPVATALACASAGLFAQTAVPEPPGVSASAILQTLFGLALIVGILFVGAYGLRRLNDGKRFGANGPMKVLGGLSISPRERIMLVEVGDSWLVIGVVPGQIRTLHTLPRGELPHENQDGKPFGQWLKQISERNHAQ